MKTKGLWMALMALMMCFVCNEAYAYDIAVKNANDVTIYYKYINQGKELRVTYETTSYNSYSGSVVIPEEVTYGDQTRKVTSIGDYAFRSCSGLTSVTIPNSVTSIGYAAFRDCSSLTSVHITDLAAWCKISFDDNPLYYAHHLYLNNEEITDLVIPDGVTSIGDRAFYGCSGLTSVTIPNSVTSIENSAFSGCSGLTSVTIGSGVTSIGDRAFYGCSSLTSVTIGNSVTSIGYSAFRGCTSLTSVTIPGSVTSIGEYAFCRCSGLTSVAIGSGVTSIGERAFNGCSGLTSVHITDLAAWCKISFSDYAYSNPLSSAHHLYLNNEEITDLVIPESVTSIGGCAFYGCSGLTSVTIGNSVTSIGYYAFEGCRLENVMALNSKTEGQQSFSARTYQHAMLYIQEGTWGEAVYDGGWYQFNNIREIAMNTAKLSSSQAYTLMDTKSFGYAVYDETNGKVKMVKAFYSVDEQDLNNCWQVRMQAGRRYLYNLGARKYAIVTPDGQIAFADSETEMALTDGENGVMMGADGSHQWGFVKNKNIPVETDITTLSSDTEKKVPIHIFSPDGKRSATPQRGINIVDGKKVVVR